MDKALESKLKAAVDLIIPEVVALRHWLHQHPEIACAEHETSARIRKTLTHTHARTLKPFLGTDVVAVLHGRKPGRHVALRADMDALPLAEKTELPYASANAGLMHACGHDGHTAILLGTASVLDQLRAEFDGTVRFVFQPGEEVVAAGQALVASGALGKRGPDMIFALHGSPGLAEGMLTSRSGVLMAAAGFFKLTIQGKGAHGSRPETAVDPILIGARVVEALAALPREVSALQSAVVSVCRFAGGSNGNVIPDTAEIEGTVRYLDRSVGRKLPPRIRRLAQGLCSSMGATCQFSYREPYRPTVNHADAVKLGRQIAEHLLGKRMWQETKQPSMGGEDFSYYLQKHPGAMFWLGMGEKSSGLHNPHYDFNDRAIRNGILFLAGCALEALAKPRN